MNKTFRTLAAILLFALAPAVMAFAQTQPSGPCNLNLSGSSPLYFWSGGASYCPPGVNQVWTPLLTTVPVPGSSLAANTVIGSSPIQIAHATYSFAVDGGAIGAITPASNFTLPINAVITNVAINSTTALTSGGSATIAVGTSAGSAANSLKAATAVASYSTNAFLQGITVPQTASTWLKLTAAGQAQITVATAALTAGILEIYVFYYVSSS